MTHFTIHAGRLAVALSVALVITACNQEKARPLQFGYQPFGNNLPFFVAMEEGFFDSLGVAIEPIKIISANDAANAIVQGRLVGDATVPLNVVLNIEEQEAGHFRIFMVKTTSSNKWSDYLLTRPGLKIGSVRELAGKRVGAYPGSAQQAILRLILDKFAIADSVTYVELPPNTQLPALQSGQVDALLTYDEIGLTAIQQGVGTVLVENPIGKYVVDPMYGFPYVLSTEFVRTQPNRARAIIDAFYRAADFIDEHELESRQVMSKWVGVPDSVARHVRLWDQVKAESIDVARMQELADLFADQGITTRRVSIQPLIVFADSIR